MIKFIIVTVLLIIILIIYASLMKAAGKETPPMLGLNDNKAKDKIKSK